MNDDEIRALLRDARVTEPMPADVVERLDDVLVGLRDAAPDRTTAPVVPLRRRVAPRLLLAAAAAVVVVAGIGVGVQQLVDDSGGGESTSVQSDTAPAEREVPRSVPAPRAADTDKSLQSDSAAPPAAAARDRDLLRAMRRLPARDTFSGLLEKVPAARLTDLSAPVQDSRQDYSSSHPLSGSSCVAPFLAALPGAQSSIVPTRAGRALLVVGPDWGADVHLVELWSCSSHELLARDTLDLG